MNAMHMAKIIVQTASLACKAPGLLISFYYQRRIGARTFRRELLQAGIAAEWADELTDCYKTMVVPKWNHWF